MTFPISSISVAPRGICASPLQYPGAKSWIMPHVRKWLIAARSEILIEPFTGGGVVSLTSLQERLVQRTIMIELDKEVADFWKAVLKDPEWMAEKIVQLKLDHEHIKEIVQSSPTDIMECGFRTLVKNRTTFSGALHGRIKNRTLHTKWYPKAWAKRLMGIKRIASQITFIEGDSLQILPDLLEKHRNAAVFVDPPYSDGGVHMGREFYRNSNVNPVEIFELLSKSNANFLMTYDTADEIVDLIHKYGFHAVRVLIRSNQNTYSYELVITRDPIFSSMEINLFE